MRSRILILMFGFVLSSGWFATDCRAQAQVNLTWNACTNAGLAGYYLAWGPGTGNYTNTNTYAPTQTSGVISNLAYNTIYYIAVAAFNSNGQVSPFSNEQTYEATNGSAPPSTGLVVESAPPPLPPMPGIAGVSSSAPPSTGGTTTTTTSGSSAGGSSASGTTSSTNITQAQIWGIPPVLGMAVSNGQPELSIDGTVGATVMVQSLSDLRLTYSWSTLTNVALTNIAPVASNNASGQPQDAIDLAFVPAAQTVALPASASTAPMEFFRVQMPYDYIVLAGQVLPPKGYPARLIVVNMPGLNDDACYVSQSGSFIHYSPTNAVLQLEPSGSTIRQIATTLANNLNLDWTTASEFIYSNGMGQVLATVVEADPASSDPVAGTTPTSSIVINF